MEGLCEFDKSNFSKGLQAEGLLGGPWGNWRNPIDCSEDVSLNTFSWKGEEINDYCKGCQVKRQHRWL